MGCKECGKPKCNGKCGCNSPKVLQINNPAEYITFHKVSIPAAMGDSTTNPPKIGAYRNALVYYEADHTSWMYSTDGIPTLVTGEQGETGPQGSAGTVAVGTTTTGEPGTQARVYNSGTDSNAVLNFEIPRGDVGPSVPLVQETGNSTTKAMSQNATTEALNGKQNTLTAGSNIQISGSTISATDTTYTAGNNVQINGTTISATDTTYTAGNGLNLNGTEFSADTDVLATKEDLEGYYTKPETDNLLAPKLETEVVTELPTTGAEGKLYLTPKAHTTQTATGNPITATVAEDVGKIESFQLDGDTFQQSYTGKNLVATTRVAAQTQNGVTCTWDGASFTLDGTSTASTDFYGRGWWGATSDPIALPAGTYTMSLRKSDGSLATGVDFSIDCYHGTTHIIGIYRGQSGTGFSTKTFDSDTQYSVFYISLMSGKTYNNEKFYIQLEKSESPTSYEPYVGGQASPNPDYPQAIQTVTELQTVEIIGKNLFDKNNAIRINGEIDASMRFLFNNSKTVMIRIEPNTTYTVSKVQSSRSRVGTSKQPIEVDNRLSVFVAQAVDIGSGRVSATITSGPEDTYLYYTFDGNVPESGVIRSMNSIQIEKGATATAYTPYSKQTLPINLGSIELCKLGTYKDYIWKDGEDWKVHKAIVSAIIDGSEDWNTSGTNKFYVANIYSKIGNSIQSASTGEMYASHFTIVDITSSNTLVGANLKVDAAHNVSNLRIRLQDMSGHTADFRQMLSAKKPSIYARRLTPTDTTITDSNLIAQLEAIRTASLQNGANIITNTATGSNLAGDMEFDYCEYDPTNRYDKWLWLDIDNEYEQIGG